MASLQGPEEIDWKDHVGLNRLGFEEVSDRLK